MQDLVDLVRQDSIPNLIEQAASNWRSHGQGALFEFGKGYFPKGDSLPTQRRWLSVVLWQREEDKRHGPGSLFGRGRSLVEDILRCAATELNPVPGRGQELPGWGHPAQSLVYGQDVVVLSRVHPRVRAAVDLEEAKLVAIRIDLEALLASSAQGAHFVAPSRFPQIKCDIALALPTELPFAEVEQALRQVGGKTLVGLELFDVYEEGALAEQGQRSLAFHAVLQAADRTLSEKDEQKFLRKIGQAAERLGGSLRS